MAVNIHDQTQATAYFKLLHDRAEANGCDFWWIDGSVRRADGRDECSWLNHTYRAHLVRQPDHLPIVLARAGGLGAHRDAILFTGDACSQWEVLAFEVETTVRAAGALMAYVSHDIGGFYHDAADRDENKPPDDLYLRWLQFGSLSPIMRLHSFDGVREPWRFAPATLDIARRFLQLRMRLLPYTTGLLDEAHETGVVPARPMWMEYADEAAYQCLQQYLLGADLLVAPVINPDGEARYWIPPGTWHHAFQSRSQTGPCWIEERVPIEFIPLWLRDGAALELADARQRTRESLAGKRQVVRGSGWA
jgi:alpha-glucosidase (family GH31 glycosyl hydrolase)